MSALTGELGALVDDPFTWIWEKCVEAVTISALALTMAFVLYYTWTPFASAFSFLHPLGGYWNCTLVALGVIAVANIVQAVQQEVFYAYKGANDEHVRAVAIRIAIVGGLAYLVATFLT